ncbi:threonine/serine dehydratase [Pigmentiphaga aceris]|uniref:Threonine/serine dehydratase n=1 Tax=Pigmentiphaga aceris TaxID=1940612 RepID=A0A5C0AW89_9BURK|nr:threonine/serine dehydratase [Pigmentiphaga aceris]QEI05894.1 threonine/serine dehydratase [Pigmentiphaga aceris]
MTATALRAADLPDTIAHELLGSLRVPRFADVQAAAQAIAPYVRRTPLIHSASLSERAGGNVWLKLECQQLTGSFKLRGAFNAILALNEEERARGVVAYSTGNHGQAIAWAASKLGVPATIVMPVDAPRNKVEKALAKGAQVVHYDRRIESREEIGMRLMSQSGASLVPPGDHPLVLAAQGTVALESVQDLPADEQARLGLFAAPCGGGGMMAGCCLALDALVPTARRIAVEPEAVNDTVRSLASGQRETNPSTASSICDALMAVTPAELPWAINGALLSGAVSVTDDEVLAAMRFGMEDLRLVLEPGGAVALAALLAGKLSLQGQSAVIVLSGANVDLPLLRTALS